MTQDLTLVIRFKDIEHDDDVHSHLDRRFRQLSHDFPEASHLEIHLETDADDVSAHALARGKNVDLAAKAVASGVRAAGEAALDKLQRELRRGHDKRIFRMRREARRGSDRKRAAH